jgi:hypothetical protein
MFILTLNFFVVNILLQFRRYNISLYFNFNNKRLRANSAYYKNQDNA